MRFLFICFLFSLNVAFADAETQINIEHPETVAQMQALIKTTGSKQEFANTLINYLRGLRAGSRLASVTIDFNNDDVVQATGEIGVKAGPNVGDTFTIGPATWTAIAEASTRTSLTFNVGSTTTVSAANIALAVNADVDATMVSAVSSGSTVTLTAGSAVSGNGGNAVYYAEDTGDARLTIDGNLFTGGVDDTSTTSTSTFGFGK